jgi:DNA-binding transcriptional MerR regulator
MSLVVPYMSGFYSTSEVAEKIGIAKRTLIRWLKDCKIAEPKRVEYPGIISRLWSERDVERLRKYKEQNYRKGRGRKKSAE